MAKPLKEHRIPIMMTAEDLTALDQFQFGNRIATRASAIRCLIRLGLQLSSSATLADRTVKRAARSYPTAQRAAIAKAEGRSDAVREAQMEGVE